MIIEFTRVESLIIYSAILFLCAYFFGFFVQREKSNKAFLSLVPAVVLFMFHKCGTDMSNYETIISGYAASDLLEILSISNFTDEIGFQLLSFVFYNIGGMTLVKFVIACIILIPAHIVFKNNSEKMDPYMASFIFLLSYFTTSLNIMRQMMAVSIIYLAVDELKKGRTGRFFVLLICAMSLHISGLIGVLFYLFYLFKNIRKGNASIIFIKFVWVMTAIVVTIFVVFGGIILSRYGMYLGHDSTVIAENRDIYIILLVVIVSYIVYSKIKRKDSDAKDYLIFVIMGLLITTMGFLNTYIKRFAYSFNIYEIYFMSNIYEAFVPKKLSKALVVIFYYTLFLVTKGMFMHGGIVPLILEF